jgi:DNA-binding transcriptional LysR family regulator
MSTYDWDDLRHFLALAETLHLGRAAALLSGSQVTVMRRVRALEHKLDATLFVRRRNGHTLTPAGAALLAVVREADEVLGRVSTVVQTAHSRQQGRVRIATTEVGANWMLLPGLTAFVSQHPQIRLEIDASPQAQDLLVDAETLALRFHRPEAGDYVVQRLGSLPYSIYGRRDLLAASPVNTRYIGWAGPFEDIGVSRWMRQVFAPHPPRLSLTTLHGHIGAARTGAAFCAGLLAGGARTKPPCGQDQSGV